MSKDPFGDLDVVMGSGETNSGPEPKPGPAGEDVGTDDAVEPDDGSAAESASAEPVDPRECPVFEFDETARKTLYVLEVIADEFSDIITYDMGRGLTRDHGLKGIMKSELHDATFAVVTEHSEEIVERVLERRSVDDGDSE